MHALDASGVEQEFFRVDTRGKFVATNLWYEQAIQRAVAEQRVVPGLGRDVLATIDGDDPFMIASTIETVMSEIQPTWTFRVDGLPDSTAGAPPGAVF